MPNISARNFPLFTTFAPLSPSLVSARLHPSPSLLRLWFPSSSDRDSKHCGVGRCHDWMRYYPPGPVSWDRGGNDEWFQLLVWLSSGRTLTRYPWFSRKAESGLVSGFMTENSASVFVFFLAEYANILICALNSILFFMRMLWFILQWPKNGTLVLCSREARIITYCKLTWLPFSTRFWHSLLRTFLKSAWRAFLDRVCASSFFSKPGDFLGLEGDRQCSKDEK